MRNCPMNESTHCNEQLGFSYSNREIGNSSECIVAKLATPF